jgi:TatD DNase family protein
LRKYMSEVAAIPEPHKPDPASLRWTDAHCHLEYGEFGSAPTPTFYEEIAAAADHGVLRLVDVGTDLARSRLACEHSQLSPHVFATVGLHPHDATQGWDWIQPMLEESVGARIVGIGECGLDYHYNHSPKDEQQKSFAAQIHLAHQYDLALVIHTREAWEDTWAILRSEGVPTRTVFHCFTGGPAEAEVSLALAEGVMLSFSGIVSYKSATELREAAVLCPMDRFTVETDSPYLAPLPHRGKRNSPGYVSLVGAAFADAKGEDLASVSAASWSNADRLFGLSAYDLDSSAQGRVASEASPKGPSNISAHP